jgi:glycosyltransferase involved in cell wall biosynthesis
MRTQMPELASRLLSIVIITRNEARNVARCIESVLEAVSLFKGTQVILVDSASTDETCDIAQRNPISVVKLRPNWLLTPAAGRYIGTLRTSSEYLLFVDGDMVLAASWVKAGVEFMQQHPRAAAVSGDMDEIYLEGDKEVGTLRRRYHVREAIEVLALGGAGLYRRLVLDQVGTFNPFVPLREEAELALRLRRAGYTLHRLPDLIATHYSAPRHTLREVRRRLTAGYYSGFGRALNYSFRSGLGWRFLRDQGMAFISFVPYLLLGVVGVIWLVFWLRWELLAAWLALTAMALAVFAVRKKSLKAAFLGFIARGLIVFGGVAGALAARHDPPQYPTDVIVIKP